MSDSDSEYDELPAAQPATVRKAPQANAATPAASSSSNSGLVIGVVAAGVAIAGAVGLKLVLGSKKSGASTRSAASSPIKKTVAGSPGKKTVPRRTPSTSSVGTAAAAAAATAAAATAAATVASSSAPAPPAAARQVRAAGMMPAREPASFCTTCS